MTTGALGDRTTGLAAADGAAFLWMWYPSINWHLAGTALRRVHGPSRGATSVWAGVLRGRDLPVDLRGRGHCLTGECFEAAVPCIVVGSSHLGGLLRCKIVVGNEGCELRVAFT